MGSDELILLVVYCSIVESREVPRLKVALASALHLPIGEGSLA